MPLEPGTIGLVGTGMTIAKSPALGPAMVAGENVRFAPPEFVRVVVRVTDVLTATVPKFSGDGEKVTIGTPAELFT